jgi:hypothetical protein
MVTKATGGARGRPPLALRDDPERHAIAHFVARLTLDSPPYVGPPTALAKLIMQAHHGVMKTEEERAEVAEAIQDGRDFRISMKKLNGLGDADNKRWQDRDSANALADNFCKKARKLERKLIDPSEAEDATSDQKDAHWLAMMSKAWRIALGRYSYTGDPFAVAARLAAKAGETDYFWRVLASQFFAHSFLRFQERPIASRPPDLNPNDRVRILP